MLVNNDHRYQFLYFFLSGAVASAILLLVYFSVRASVHERLQDDLKQIQQTLTFTRPSTAWEYNNSWRAIGNVSRREQIYSAYFDARTDVIDQAAIDEASLAVGSVRVFAILPQRFDDALSCVLRYDDFTLGKEVRALDVSALTEQHEAIYAVYTIMCPLLHPREQILTHAVRLPQAVALAYASNRLSHISPTFVPISYPRDFDALLPKSRPALAVCVGPLQFDYSDALAIAEFVEMHRLLGAEHFYFYNLAASEQVLRLLRHYSSVGLASLLEWRLDDYTDEELYYGGIFGQINDCIYRAMAVDNYRYAAVLDLDELLMTLKHNSLAAFLRQCDEGRTSAFVFRSVFFNRKDANDTYSTPPRVRNRRLYAQTKVRRTVEVMPAYTRSKCVVNVRSILEMGNHLVWRALPGYTDHVLHPSVGLLYHYRDKCINCKSALMVDYAARRFGSHVWQRVDDVCLRVYDERPGGECPHS